LTDGGKVGTLLGTESPEAVDGANGGKEIPTPSKKAPLQQRRTEIYPMVMPESKPKNPGPDLLGWVRRVYGGHKTVRKKKHRTSGKCGKLDRRQKLGGGGIPPASKYRGGSSTRCRQLCSGAIRKPSRWPEGRRYHETERKNEG